VSRSNAGNLLNYRSSPFDTWNFLSTNQSANNCVSGANLQSVESFQQSQPAGLLNSLLTFPSPPVSAAHQQSFNFQQSINPYDTGANGNGKNFFNYLNSFPSIMGLNGNPNGYATIAGSTGIRNSTGQ